MKDIQAIFNGKKIRTISHFNELSNIEKLYLGCIGLLDEIDETCPVVLINTFNQYLEYYHGDKYGKYVY